MVEVWPRVRLVARRRYGVPRPTRPRVHLLYKMKLCICGKWQHKKIL